MAPNARPTLLFGPLALALLLLAAPPMAGSAQQSVADTARTSGVRVATITELERTLSRGSGAYRVTVLYELDCPLSMGFFPHLVELAREFQPRGVAFVAYNTNADPADLAAVPAFLRGFDAPFEARWMQGWRMDEGVSALRRLGVAVVDRYVHPLVIVQDGQGKVIFSGDAMRSVARVRRALGDGRE